MQAIMASIIALLFFAIGKGLAGLPRLAVIFTAIGWIVVAISVIIFLPYLLGYEVELR